MKRFFILVSLMIFVFPIYAHVHDRYPFQSHQQEEQFEKLVTQMRCMVCQNQNLADSNSGFAEDMRVDLYKMVKSGQSDREIIQKMEGRYGYFISFKPPFYLETYFLWSAPFLLMLIAIVIAFLVLRKYRSA